MLDHTPKACGSLGHGKRSPQKKATMTYLTKAPLNEALGTLEASNHSYQKAPLKATRTKMNGTSIHRHPLPWARISHATANLLPPPSFLR